LRFNSNYVSVSCTGVGSGGYAGDLTPPTIYLEDIDMYIVLEKPNTYPCKLYATRTEMLGKAI